MTKLYPALKAKMGNHDYYVVKMQMKDVVKEIGFASEIYDNKTLDYAIQRELNEGRAKKEIVNYLTNKHRFFSSIVVAALGGNPEFYPVEITDDPRFTFFKPRMNDAFGVLTFDGGQKYFALDGQHRLKAIQTLIEQKDAIIPIPEIPPGFLDEEISVIILVREEENHEKFMQDYRRIFSALNRYAKPTDIDTNIIMDEEDAIAILTRRLLNEYDFFAWSGRPDNPKVKTKGKNLEPGRSHFTSLQTLYYMNERLLTTPVRESQDFMSKKSKQFRPREHELENLYGELVTYWDAILAEIDVLNNDPLIMRGHDEDPQGEGLTDHLLFRPIGQEMFVDVIRILLNRRLPDPDSPTLSDLKACIAVMAKVNWSLHEPPWEGLLLIPHPKIENKWQMRSEDRKHAIAVGKRIVMFQIGLDDPSEEMLEELKTDWHALLIPRPVQSEVDEMWERVSKKLA